MSPLQVEDGNFTRIVNEVLDQLVKAGLLGSELSLVLFLIRKTWGYNKTKDYISLTQFEQALNLTRPTIVKTLKNLVRKKLIIRSPIPHSNTINYAFNKYWDKWVVNAPLLVKSMHEFGKAALTETSKAALTHKRQKENKRGYEKFLKQRDQLIKAKSVDK